MRVHASRLAGAAITSVAMLMLAGCGSSSSSSPPATTNAVTTAAPATTPSTTPSVATSTVTVSADPAGALKFIPTTITAKAGTVTVEMKNPSSSGLAHGIAVQGNGVDQDGKTVQPGGTSTDTLTLKPGTYRFYCPVPGHEAAGMTGTLIVT